MEEILKEQAFHQIGCTSDECAVEVGELLSVRQILIGSISKVGTVFSVSARIVDVESGEIVNTEIDDFKGDISDLLTLRMLVVAKKIAGLDNETFTNRSSRSTVRGGQRVPNSQRVPNILVDETETIIKNSVDINGGTGLFAQGGLTIVGGLNMGSIKYNDSDMADEFDVSMKMGFSIGAETMAGPLKVGGGFVQRGANVEVVFINSITQYGEKFEVSETINYLSGYGLYPFSIQEGLSAFGGFQLGKCIGGKAEFSIDGESESEDLKGEDFALDYGLLLGVDYSINANMGVRASYYLGLADVVEDVDSDFNYKHSGIGVSLLYKMQ